MTKNRDNLAINTIKVSGTKAVNLANSGHPGIVLGAATITHTLFTRHLIFDPKNPKWVNRDRFVLSAGHGSALLYSQLRLIGLIKDEDLKNFRQYKSITPGHPEYGLADGVEATTGPLGQGIANGIGIALAQESLKSRFSEIDHFTYVLCGDGDLQEGVAMEAMSFAGYQQLSKLIILHDSNDIQLDTAVDKVFRENLKMRVEAVGFDYQIVTENTVEAIDKAITKAKSSSKPSFIEIKTIIGDGAQKQGTSAVHGAPLGDDFENVKKKLNWEGDEFHIPQEVKKLYEETIIARGQKAFSEFKMSSGLSNFLSKKPMKIDLEIKPDTATRVSSGTVIQHLNQTLPNWIGGSADLSGSTKASGGDGVFSKDNRKGRNILFGVREFGMSAIANGIALHSNFRPFVSTFFVFADYLKPALRLSAIMHLPVTYIFTHDSVVVGEDGPTHEPVEQTAMIRSIPNVNFIRPADEIEVQGAYEKALNSDDKPTVIALTRQNIVSTKITSKDKVQHGPYQVVDNFSDWTLVSSGSELANAIKIAQELKLNVVSISNHDGKIFWNTQKAITIEAATTYGMKKFGKHNIGIDTFGESAPGDQVYKHFKLDKDSLKQTIKKIIS